MIPIPSQAPIRIIVYAPNTKENQNKLAQHVAGIHAAAVTQRLHALSCTAQQKLELLNAIIQTVKERSREQTE